MVEKVKVKHHKVEIDCPTEAEFFGEKPLVSKYQVFRNWCKQNGVIGLDRAIYPHRFEMQCDSEGNIIPNSGYLGTLATREIKHREVILAVPLNLCISVDRIKYGFNQQHCGKPDHS